MEKYMSENKTESELLEQPVEQIADAEPVVEEAIATVEPETQENTELSPDVTEIKTDKDTKVASKDKKRTTIGGQALIEGIMMCGPKRTAKAVRKADGSIYIEEMKQSDRVSYFEKVPFIRGCIKFYKMLVTGTDATMKSADISEQGKEDEEGKKESKLDSFLGRHRNVMLTLSAILGLALSIGLFILFPRLIVDLVSKLFDENMLDVLWVQLVRNIIEGVLRIIIFLTYLILVSKMPDIKRVWQYHGAEHKTIACYS